VELKWISLHGNEIEEILHPIFAKNKKLEVVDLSHNQIETLHPSLFDGLPRLEQVHLYGNSITSKKFDKSDMNLMRVELKPFFNNYLQKYENSFRIRIIELEVVS
jgi:Leucine-rich repeat (LRR) protein